MGEIFAATFFATGTFNNNTQSDGDTICEISFYSGIKTPGAHNDWSRGQGDNRGRGH
mgnify:FL=1